MFEIKLYRTQRGRSPVLEFMEELAKEGKEKEYAQIHLAIKRLQENGMTVNNLFPHTIRLVSDDIYELRPGSNRIFFFYYTGNEFVLLHAYKKESQKAPKNEIDKAKKERKEYVRRKENGGSDLR